GPPAPQGPTLAQFSIDVVVLRGRANQVPDQLNCDHLRLTMLPGDKSAPRGPVAPGSASAAGSPAPTGSEAEVVAEADEPEDSEGSLGGLTLRRAVATGHAVWLQSVSQGTKALCNELIYKKLAPEKPDETYLRGDDATKLRVEKLAIAQDGPDKGKIRSITTIRTIDATIFDEGQGGDAATIVAGGPGVLETRPARDKPVERRALWQDQLVVQNELNSEKMPRKRITLTGDPKFSDSGQATLDAKKEIIVWLKPKPGPADATPNATTTPAAPAAAGSATQPAGGSYEIEKLRALQDVHLTSPGRIMTADDELVAVFETRPTPAAVAGRTGATTTTTSTSTTTSTNAATPGASPTTAGAPGAPAVAAAGAPATQAEPQAKTKPAGPDVDVRAQRVWARIALRPEEERGSAGAGVPAAGERREAGDTPTEIREVRLRGTVAFHQDPEPGKQRGTNVTGEAVDVTNLGDDKMYFKVYLVDPFKVFSLDRTAKVTPEQVLAMIKALGNSVPLARVETEDFTVEGPIIGLDQRTDEAWVDGRGTLTQLAARGLLTDKGLDNATAAGPARVQVQAQAKAQPGADAKLTPMKISWKQSMQFRGQSTNPQGLPVAKAQFFADVRAEMEDSLLVCREMTTYMDRVVALDRPRRDKAAARGNEAAEPEPKPQIALIDCVGKVVIISRKLDPDSPRTVLQKQRIEGEHVTYEKLTGNFVVPGAGRVWLYNRKGQDSLASPLAAPAPTRGPATTAERRTITPTANPTSRTVPNTRRATEVVGRNSTAPTPTTINAVTNAAEKAKEKAKAARTPLAPLELTQITFNDEMHGRFGTGKGADTIDTRWADFFGDVQLLHAVVANDTTMFDFDNPPMDGTFLTAQTVRVVSEPPPPGGKDPARNFLKAWENANAATYDTTIQADKITFDSLKELFYAYGEDGRDVLIVQQKTAGMG
ncbi:MAG: hypothetical protein QOE66_2625, partial [Chloroflexota bacterium]|nr:hypothetical protein [Chloroflexota bacterium]